MHLVQYLHTSTYITLTKNTIAWIILFLDFHCILNTYRYYKYKYYNIIILSTIIKFNNIEVSHIIIYFMYLPYTYQQRWF